VTARETVAPWRGGWPVRQVDFGVHPYPPHLLPGPTSTQGPAVLGLTVGDSDTRKVEPGRGTSVGAVVRTQSLIVS
jgi:hypothetical protein